MRLADRILRALEPEFAGRPPFDAEVSLRLRPRQVESSGRFAIWRSGQAADDFAPVGRALALLDAPDEIRRAHRAAEGPVRQGISVGSDGPEPEFRLYLHGRIGSPVRDRCVAWRWRPDGGIRTSEYAFHFYPETPAGERPLDLVPAQFRPAIALLLDDPRLQAMSGFWLRRDVSGAADQIYITCPWLPEAGSLPGVVALADRLAIAHDDPSQWRSLPIRHVAFALDAAKPSVTLYSSATIAQWPHGEAALRDAVRAAAGAVNRDIERAFAEMPPCHQARPAARHLDRFYSGDIAAWQSVIGPRMHYHHGLFADPDDADPSDAAMDAALARAVTDLYPFIGRGARVYDVGCGWGGPLAMLMGDLGCDALGLTVSERQFRYVAAQNLPVRWGDAEATLPPGPFDCALLLESFCHIVDRARLLRALRMFCGRLVMRTNCQDSLPGVTAFGGTMPMISSGQLRELLQAAGWRIAHWRDRRREAMPSVTVWHRRVREMPRDRDPQIEAVRDWCGNVLADPDGWAAHHPLIEVVCERA